MLENTAKKDRMQFGRMPGISAADGIIYFRTVIRQGDFCRLHLFRKGKKEAVRTIEMERLSNTRVFCAELNPAEARYETYLYEDAQGVFADEYAGAVSGREKFGTQGEVAAILPKNMQENEKTAGFECPAFSSLLFYKLHVRGFTKSPSSGVKHKGTFAGVKEKIPYLTELGVNAVLFMPVYEFEECMAQTVGYGMLPAGTMAEYERRYGSEFVKAQRAYAKKEEAEAQSTEKVNYWGYTGKNYYFAPKASYAAEPARAKEELQELVSALHEAGIAVFFELFFGDATKQFLMLDCLRYWTETYQADGFHLIGNKLPMQLFLEDAYLSGVKFLTTEDECYGADGVFDHRRVAVYNDDFRTIARRFVKGDENMVGDFVGRLVNDLTNMARMQYIADQNGFSLYDLYAYDRKHNEENGEDNKDGEDYNYSWNCGIEGETNKKKVTLLRSRLRKNALCSVLLSRSVPLLFAGDEFGQTKKGNNNAYCQDNEISWLNWRFNKEKREQLEFVKELIAFRKAHVALCGGRTLRTEDYKGIGLPEVSYHGVSLWQPDFAPYSRCIAILYNGTYFSEGTSEDIYLIFNMHWEEHAFALPGQKIAEEKTEWTIALDTSEEARIYPEEDFRSYAVTADLALEKKLCHVPPRSVVVLVRKLPQS